MDIFHGILWVGFLLYILFETSAVFEYSRFLPEFLTKRKEYLTQGLPHGVSYAMYMQTQHDSFIVRMLSCPVCIGVWMSAVCAVLSTSPIAIPAIYLGGMVAYKTFAACMRLIERIDNDGN